MPRTDHRRDGEDVDRDETEPTAARVNHKRLPRDSRIARVVWQAGPDDVRKKHHK